MAKRIKSLLSPPRRRKLDIADVQMIAKTVVQNKCTERDACLHLGINPDQWESYKSKHRAKEGFDMLLAKLKEAKIDGLISNIEGVGNGIGVKQRDWRASAWIAERIAPERFGQRNDTASVTVNTVDVSRLIAMAQRALGVVDVKQVEQPDTKLIDAPKERSLETLK